MENTPRSVFNVAPYLLQYIFLPMVMGIPFTWSFASNETKLNLDGDEYDLVELTATKLKISASFVVAGVTYTQELTFSH